MIMNRIHEPIRRCCDPSSDPTKPTHEAESPDTKPTLGVVLYINGTKLHSRTHFKKVRGRSNSLLSISTNCRQSSTEAFKFSSGHFALDFEIITGDRLAALLTESCNLLREILSSDFFKILIFSRNSEAFQ